MKTVSWLLFLTLSTSAVAAEPGLLFYLSGDKGTTADFSAAGLPEPTYVSEITPIADGALRGALECGDTQLLAYRAPGNVFAQRGTLSFFWRSRYAVGPTAFPIFRVGYADHSSWDMVWLRIDYNGQGFDAFVTDASLSRTRVSLKLPQFPSPKTWTHLALAWDETRGIRFFVNGQLAGEVKTKARYDAALDQFGPHSRIISPYQVQSDYNFVRGGDIDEVRIHDRMLSDDAVARLAHGETSPANSPIVRSLADPVTRDAWWHRYGFNASNLPPTPAGRSVSVRKVEIHDTFDLARWWWKANDGIRETTWPGVYNRSRLPGRHDYFELPDWDCYVDSGKAVTFTLPREPWNHVEISGSAWGKMTSDEGRQLFERLKGFEKSIHRLATPLTGGKITFTNVEQEQPIGELSAYLVASNAEPAGARKLAFRVDGAGVGLTPAAEASIAPLRKFVGARFVPEESTLLVGIPSTAPAVASTTAQPSLPVGHILIPNTWDEIAEGLDGIAIDLPAFRGAPTHGATVPLNIQVKDPLWPLRAMLDVTLSVTPGETKTLWLDLRDRLLPPGKAIYLIIAAAGDGLALEGAEVRLVFKAREAARAEHELDRFTQLRDSYAMLVEERPNNARLDLWNRFKGDLDDLLRVNPDHVLGRQYAAAAIPTAPSAPFMQPVAPDGVPLWAFRQTELMGWVKKFILFYIDQRQSAYGDFGGGISDDVDLTNTWPGVALMGMEPEKVKASLRALLDAVYKNGMVANGLPAIQSDELHSYEEGINVLAQVLLLEAGSPKQFERAMETSRGVATVTGINSAGHRHFRSSYYSGTKIAEEDPWGWSKPYSNLVLHVPQLVVEYNGAPAARKYLLELADGLLAHRKVGANGRASLPTAIHFASDREGSVARGGFPWHVFWGPWRWTNDRKYLDPIFDGGNASLMQVNANALDLLNLRKEFARAVAPAAETAGDIRPGGRVNNFRGSSLDHFGWQIEGDKRRLERLYANQIEACANLHYINTEGSLWIDRVSVPTAELQRARLGGVALVRNALYPGHLVSWEFAAPATAQSVALLMPDATSAAFKVIAYNLDALPVRATIMGANIDPGVWDITQGNDTDGDDQADGTLARQTAPFERSRGIETVLPPRTTSVLTFKLKSPSRPYWQRADLGIDREDISLSTNSVRVRVHNLGGKNSEPTSVMLRDTRGRPIAQANVPSLAAPEDLLPKIIEVDIPLPAGAIVTGATVELDPDSRLEEITKQNNIVKL